MLKSPAWWSLAITLVIAIGSSMLTSARVESKTDVRVLTLEKQVPAMEERFNERIDRLEDRMDKHKDELKNEITELRGIILNRR